MQQLPLDLQIRSTEQHGDFIISDCNSIAAQWIDRWPDWVGQFCALNIAGPEAEVVNHLAAVWQAKRYCLVILMTILQVSVMRCISSLTAGFRWVKRDCFISSTIPVTLVDHC